MHTRILRSAAAAALLLAACGKTSTRLVDKLVPSVEDRSGHEELSAHVIAPPDDAAAQFAEATPPAVEGTTPVETTPTVISGYRRYAVTDDLVITQGRLNHSRGERITSAEFRLGAGLSLVPVERSGGQFTMERTTDSANHAVDAGQDLLLAVNADAYDMVNGWNAGLIKLNGVTYTGFSDDTWEAVAVYDDGHAAILDSPPAFQLRLAVDGVNAGPVGSVYSFDLANHVNAAFSRGETGPDVYPGDNYRGAVDLTGKTGALVRPEVNGVTVVDQGGGRVKVVFAPFQGRVTSLVSSDPAFVIPSGYALIVGSPAPLAVGQQVKVSYETDDPSWAHVVTALGAGLGSGLLVEDGAVPENLVGDTSLNARCAFGIRADGSYFFLVADKPTGSLVDGVTRTKMGQLLIAYGAVRAINLDGGGSTTIAARLPGERYLHLLNVPSDGSERVVANKWALALDAARARYASAVAVYPRELTVLAGSLYRRFRGVGYDGASWRSVLEAPEYGMDSAALGLIDPVSGAFRAGAADADGYVVVKVGAAKGVARVHVVTAIDAITLGLTSTTIDAGASVALSPRLEKGGAEVAHDASVLRYAVDRPDLCTVDPATATLTAANVQGQRCTVTVSYGAVSVQKTLAIGVAPVVFENFEGDPLPWKPAGDLATSVALEPTTSNVFSGKVSMKLSWVTDPNRPGTFGAYVSDPKKSLVIPGYPKYLGVHVYIPDELAGKVWWVRGALVDGAGKSITINYNNDGQALPERGWHFMKAAIPAGYTEPLKCYRPFRFLVLKTAERIDSSVVVDDFTAIYSDTTDLDGPGVSVTPAADTAVTSAAPTISLQAFDATGVDPASLSLQVDDRDVSASVVAAGGDRFTYAAADLAEGWHKVAYRVADRNGNVSAGDQLFDVHAGGGRVDLDASAVRLYPGATFELPLDVQRGDLLGTYAADLTYDATKVSLTVVAGDLTPTAVTEEAGRWRGTFTGFAAATRRLATLRFTIKPYVTSAQVAIALGGTLDGRSLRYPVLKLPVGSKYSLAAAWGLQGAANRLLVLDGAGTPAPGVTVELVVYNAARDEVTSTTTLGTSDASGYLTAELPASDDSEDLVFRAYDDAGASLMTPLHALVERFDATPRHVLLTPGADGQVNVTWMTATTATGSIVTWNVQGQAATSSAEGSSEVVPFLYGPEAGLVRVHHATLHGLSPGATYSYTVGDASTAAGPFAFTADPGGDAAAIYLFGDTQTIASDNIFNGNGLVTELYRKMRAQLPGGGLVLHVGDFTDDLSSFQLVRLFLDALEGQEGLAGILFAPTEGNHEVLNEGADKFASLFALPGNGPAGVAPPYRAAVYSFDHGPAHVAVLSSEVPEAQWPAMIEWLKADMAASRKTWRILSLHRPPYAGNPASGNGLSARWIPAAVDAAGVDLVVSGHDHMYARTVPLAGGVPRATGATYLIAGSDSAKYYDSNGTGIAALAAVLYDTDQNTFTTLELSGARLRILTRAIDGRVVDDAVLNPRPRP